MSNFIENIIEWDKNLFKILNGQWNNAFFDSIFPWWREATTWAPLYLFLLVFVFINFGAKSWKWVLFLLVTVTVTDQVSSNLIKNLVQRLRPCSDPNMIGYVRMLLNHCSGGYSFTSSHATNHFGVAMFIFLTAKPIFPKTRGLFFLWALSVAYGQVYVGVHYPIDITMGALLGCALGSLTAFLFKKLFGNLFAE